MRELTWCSKEEFFSRSVLFCRHGDLKTMGVLLMHGLGASSWNVRVVISMEKLLSLQVRLDELYMSGCS